MVSAYLPNGYQCERGGGLQGLFRGADAMGLFLDNIRQDEPGFRLEPGYLFAIEFGYHDSQRD